MSSTEPIVLLLEFERTGEQIAGRVCAAAGPPMPFAGWLGLAAAIEQATAAGPIEKMRDDPS
jgi:hypothetical protein